MNKHSHKSKRKKSITSLWNDKNYNARLKLIMDHAELFWSLRLITRSEIALVLSMSESNREFVMLREDQPFFTSLNLKTKLENQRHSAQLKAALSAAFV